MHILLKKFEDSLPHEPMNSIVERMELMVGQGGRRVVYQIFSQYENWSRGLNCMSLGIKLHFSLKFPLNSLSSLTFPILSHFNKTSLLEQPNCHSSSNNSLKNPFGKWCLMNIKKYSSFLFLPQVFGQLRWVFCCLFSLIQNKEGNQLYKSFPKRLQNRCLI